jgi:hypothetical protein
MKIFKQLISAVALSILASTAVAQTAGTESTTPNLITSGTGHTWTGISITGPLPTDAMPGGPGALYDPNTNTIHFSYGQSTVAQTYAINQALANSGSGIQVQGYNYSWEINNLNYDNRQPGTDTLTARVITFDPAGNIRRNDSWTYNTKFDWTTFSGSVNYFTPGPTSEFGNLRVEFSGVDSGFWGGYFGPQVRNVDVRLRYTVDPVDPCISDPQSSPSCPGFKTFYSIPDDGHAIVPIPFGFPFYGQTFTHSIFFDNGAVSFYSPTQPQRWGGGGLSMPALSESMSSSFFYTIVPLKTDLIANGGRHFTQGDGNYLRYTWEDVSQFGRWDSRNTFSLEIRPTGYIGLQYDKIDIQGSWTSAIIGNASLGEYQTIQNNTSTTTTSINSWSISDTTATDCSNPLNHPNCPGYAQAYFDQQCSINALYSTSCPGYAQAYFDQQCTISALYDPSCPGYVVAYYDYQCSLDPLYHTGCPGHAQAYFDQQCSLDPLYDEACPGYAQAFFDQQCSLDPLYDESCPLYADAFYVQQCTLDPLYDSGCTGYAEAFAKKYILTAPVSEPVTVAAVSESEEIVETAAVSETPAATVDPSDTTAPVQLVENTAPAPQPAAAPAPSTETAAAAPAARTTRQALAERRLASARAQAEQRARENPAAVASEMDSADSMEQQVELQSVVLGAMSFVPGFDAYGRATVPDAAFYPPLVIYPGQRNIDSPAARGLLGRSDRLHQEMVDAQYR